MLEARTSACRCFLEVRRGYGKEDNRQGQGEEEQRQSRQEANQESHVGRGGHCPAPADATHSGPGGFPRLPHQCCRLPTLARRSLCEAAQRRGWTRIAVACWLTLTAAAQTPPARLTLFVHDETATPVASARVELLSDDHPVAQGSTDAAGHGQLDRVPAGSYRLVVEKPGFYPATTTVTLRPGAEQQLEISLLHEQEYRERVEVTYTPPAIDPQATAAAASLTATDVIHLPYGATRDYRNALPLLPNVLGEPSGQVHLDGSASWQVDSRLDGFDIAQPTSGLLQVHLSPDVIRHAEADTARLPVTAARTGGTLELETPMGDDRFRFSATDFIPSFQSRRGIHIESFTPRLSLSGPIARGRAWFYDAADGEYDLTIVPELPRGADQAPQWRWSNLLKAQVNLTPHHLLTAGLLVNRVHAPRQGLDVFHPLETTSDHQETIAMGWWKLTTTVAGDGLLEWGAAFTTDDAADTPRGPAPLVLFPDGAAGNAFEQRAETARRQEALLHLYLPEQHWHGVHHLLFGFDFDRVSDDQHVQRHQLLIRHSDGTLVRQVDFTSPVRVELADPRLSFYLQDGWSPHARLFLNGGLRVDHDGLLDSTAPSPRLAASYLLTADGRTKLSAGVGLLNDVPPLDVLEQPRQGSRLETFFGPDGVTPLGPPVPVQFVGTPRGLTAPQSLQWSFGLERMLATAHLQLDYLARRGRHGFAYQFSPQPTLWQFRLLDGTRTRYDAVRLTLRLSLAGKYPLLLAYTRARTHSSAVLDETLASPLFAVQQPGRLAWDAPNQLLSWGWLPLPHRFQLAYVLHWHTGFPFNVVNQAGELIGLPNQLRFPDEFSLNLHVERRFRLFGFQWAIRGGFDNLTDHRNPTAVVNNVDSPRFLQFAGLRGRAFTGRIRFLGRK